MDKAKAGAKRMIFCFVESNIPLNPPSKGDILILQNQDWLERIIFPSKRGNILPISSICKSNNSTSPLSSFLLP
jgi:hypothetical protein